jgi:phage tail protein X
LNPTSQRPPRQLAATVLVLALALASSIARAAETPVLERRIDIDLVDAVASQVFASFAAMLETELDLAPALAERTLSIRLDDVQVRTALAAACDSISCVWELAPPASPGAKPRLAVREASPAAAPGAAAALDERLDEIVSLDLDDATLEQVLASFARILGAELDLDPALRGGTASIQLTGVKVRDALDTLLGRAWNWRLESEGAAARLVIRRRAS